MKRTAFSNARGFSTLQLVITVAVMTIVAGFAVVGITRARDHVRLVNSARQFAAYVERARADSVRRHAAPANAATVSVLDDNTYAVTMDWDGFGAVSTRNFDLEQGILFTPGMVGKSISFDWRGRIASEESFGFDNTRNQVNVHVTGSGDVTFDTERFYDALIPASPPTVAGGGVTPEPGASPLPPPPPATPTPTPPGTDPTPTPTPDQYPTPTPTPDQYPTPTPTPDPNATPTPDQNPTPTPTPTQPCVLNAPDSLLITSDASATVSVNRTNITGTGTINANSSNSGQIQVSPTSRTVDGTAAGSFTIAVKKQSGSVTFSATGCTSKTVNITVP